MDFLVFFSVPSQLPSDHGNGPSGWASTDLMSNFLLVAISTIWPNNLWSAFRAVSLLVLLGTLRLFMSEKVFNFSLGSGSWKGVFLSLIHSSWKYLYAVSPRALAVRRSIATSEGATVPVERLISSAGSPLNGLIYSVSIKLTSDCTASSSFRIRDDSKSW